MDIFQKLKAVSDLEPALDIIYDEIDTMMRAGEFDEISQLFDDFSLDEFPIDFYLGFLSASIPIRDKIKKSRLNLLKRLREKWHETPDDDFLGLD